MAGRTASRAVVEHANNDSQLGIQALDGGGVGIVVESQRARQPLASLRIRRQLVGAPQRAQLQPVLHGAQERVGLPEPDGILLADVAALDECGQRRQRPGCA